MSSNSKVQILNHPLVIHKLSVLRNKETSPKEVRELLKELSLLLALESTRDLPLISKGEQLSPVGSYEGFKIGQNVGLFPILRAGLGLMDGFLSMVPTAKTHHLGLYREKSTFLPVEYYNKLPSTCAIEAGFVLDPMIATAGTAIASVSILKDWGLKNIKFCCVVASRVGLDSLIAAHPDIEIYVYEIFCAVDEVLTSGKYIVPGLGDAGDRIFNTFHE
ncbi:hypothetical protein HK099_002887 [Clydaea vesicula]|uniref:uracil phosphoribosyltransferase n=1 Tax=Clydaea vesicula TaxID=447962 RepID=A0AAD5Y230_9FUNG|nr:hypothetical protein HK099_002887 [Clydaea vesicula]KAJ3397030.1 hypothetical protein HDU92_001043 [Lobulomyces angularis]